MHIAKSHRSRFTKNLILIDILRMIIINILILYQKLIEFLFLQ